jgi:hypothetical protein
MAGQRDGAQHADLGKGRFEGDVGMPGIGAAAMLGVEFQKGRAIGRRYRGMRFDLAEQPPEGLVRCIRQMVLAPQEQHAVAQQGRADLRELFGRQFARQLHAVDHGAYAPGQRLYLQLLLRALVQVPGHGAQVAGFGDSVHGVSPRCLLGWKPHARNRPATPQRSFWRMVMRKRCACQPRPPTSQNCNRKNVTFPNNFAMCLPWMSPAPT